MTTDDFHTRERQRFLRGLQEASEDDAPMWLKVLCWVLAGFALACIMVVSLGMGGPR